MRFATVQTALGTGLAVAAQDGGMRFSSEGASNDLLTLLRNGPESPVEAGKRLARAPEIDPAHITYLPVLSNPEKIICAGLNYADHSAESGFKQPDYPALFPRFASSLVGHKAPIVRPLASDTLDYEGEVAAIVGRGGRPQAT